MAQSAAVDTSGVSIEWTLAELTRRPEIRKRLQAELDSVVGRGRPVQEEDIENLPYLRAGVLDTKSSGKGFDEPFGVGEAGARGDIQKLPHLRQVAAAPVSPVHLEKYVGKPLKLV